MGSSLGHRSTRHGKRDGRRADLRAAGYQVCVVNQGLTKHAILMYREIIRIKQRWQRCVVGGWGLEDADRRIDIRGQGSTPRRPKRASYAVSGRGSTLLKFTWKVRVFHHTELRRSFQTSSNGRYAFEPFGHRWSVQIVCSISNHRYLHTVLVFDRMCLFVLFPFC